MDKYLIILIIIIILYFIQKYCIQSEVEQILITKNIIEKFTDSNTNFLFSNVVNNLQLTKRLDLSGSLIINKRHKLTSDGNYLKLTDVSGLNFLNMSVKNLDVSGELLVRQNSTFTGGPHSFNSLNIDTSGNNAGIKSVQGNLTINGSKKILGNTDISGNLRINNVKPILIKIFTTTNNIIDTGISHSTYSGIGFSGYNHPTSSSTRTPLEFNTYKQNGKWFVSFTPNNTQSTSIRLIFFNTFFHSVHLDPPTNLRVVIGNSQATLSWDAPVSNDESPITLYTISDGSGITQTSTTNSKLVTDLSNGKMYTFTITATNATYTSVPSASINVLPLAMTPITIGTDFVGKTLVIASRALTSSDTTWERIFDFHRVNYSNVNDPSNTYIFGPFTQHTGNQNFLIGYKDVNQILNYTDITTNALTRNVTYLYVLAFLSTTQVTFNIYEYTNNSVINKGITRTISITNNFLSIINTFWLGRSSTWWDPFYNGNYSKIALYNGNLFTEPTITTILLNLVIGTSPNITSYTNSTDYAFRPVLNNFMGVIVRRLSFNTTVAAGAAAITSGITLVGNVTTDYRGVGGYLNIIGSFIEVPSAPIIGTATITSSNTEVIVTWDASINNGGSNIIDYTVRSNPGNLTRTTNTLTTNVSGLTIGIPYTFTVVARNTIGISTASAASNSVTLS